MWNVLKSMKKRKTRKRLKLTLRKSTPLSSSLSSIAYSYKAWCVINAYRSDCFFSTFYHGGLKKIKGVFKNGLNLKLNVKKQKKIDRNYSRCNTSHCLSDMSMSKLIHIQQCSKSLCKVQHTFCVSRWKLLISLVYCKTKLQIILVFYKFSAVATILTSPHAHFLLFISWSLLKMAQSSKQKGKFFSF